MDTDRRARVPAPSGGRTQPARCDVIAIGRSGVDLYPRDPERALGDVSSFSRSLGGSAANVAAAAARLGLTTAVVTRTGDDAFGAFVRGELARLGVDTRFVSALAATQTPLAFCELFPPDHFPVTFYRGSDAPDLLIAADDLDLDALTSATVLWATATGLSHDPSRDAHHAAWAARGSAPVSVLDLDYRAAFWPSPAAAREAIGDALTQVTVAVGNSEECAIAVGETDPDRAADALLDRGVRLAIVKLGPHGALAKTADERVRVPGVRLPVVNGLGAGDAFGGAVCLGLIEDLSLTDTLHAANAAGAIVASRLECAAASPTRQEIETLLAGVPA